MAGKIKNLKDLRRSIGISVYLSFVAFLIFSLVAIYIIDLQFKKKQTQLSIQQAYASNHVFQAGLSEQLWMIASSGIFLDFLRSGEETRKNILPDFLYTLSQAKLKPVVGMEITKVDGDQVFKRGEETKNHVILRLCYLDGALDNKMGRCRYAWKLFFSRSAVVLALKGINHEIENCSECEAVDLFAGPLLGGFPISSSSVASFGLKTVNNNNSFIYLIEALICLLVFAFSFWNKFWIQRIVDRYIANPIKALTQRIKQNDKSDAQERELEEIQFLSGQIELWKTEVKQIQQQKRAIELGQIVAQVAHDIDSPVKALKVIAEDLSNISEGHRIIVRNAIGRIQGIARKLLDKYSDKKISAVIGCGLVSATIDSMVLEKQAEYAGRNISITTDIASDSWFLFAKFNQGELKEVLSNILNNAIESTQECAEIKLKLYEEDGRVLIGIKDNGSGMSSAVLKNICKEGASYGKEGGSGLGLFHAKTQVEAWGGSISIESELNHGTTVVIQLHKGETPKWFPIQVALTKGASVVILDDDDSFRLVLKKQIVDSLIGRNDISIYTFARPEEMIDWAQKQKPSGGSLFLIDHEFQGSPMDGIQVIKSLKLENHAILITSRFEEEEIQKECKNSGIMLTSKTAFPCTPVVVVDSPDLVFLDDDRGITTAWKLAGILAGKSVLTFNRARDFFAVLGQLPTETPIYIDSDLNDDRTGEEVAKIVYENGHQNLTLSTGHDPKKFKNIPWIRRVVGKESPTWGQGLI